MKFAVSIELERLGIEWNAYADKAGSLFETAAKNDWGNFRADLPLVARRKLTRSTKNDRASFALKLCP
jgi:hypothetical protein